MTNWGRWGEADEIGTLNAVNAATVTRGLAAVVQNRPVSLAAPIESGRGYGSVGRPAPQHFMLRDGGDYAAGRPERGGFGFADDWVGFPTHGVTHLDALAHVWQDGLMYNGHPSTTVTSRGAGTLGIHQVPPIVTRGVLLDFVPPDQGWMPPGEPIGLDRLQAELHATGVQLAPGDALLIRTGWMEGWRADQCDATAWPGLDADCGAWLAGQDLAVVGADNIGVEVFPSSDLTCQVPLHIELIRGHGIHLAELLDLTELAAAGQASFLLVIAPLRLVGAVGSPISPVAVL